MCCTSKIDKILLIGNGGHCGVIVDALRRYCPQIQIGIVAKNGEETGQVGIPIVGCDEDLEKLFNEGWKYAFVAVGSIKSTAVRVKLTNMLEKIGFIMPSIVDPTAIISPFASIGDGAFVGAGAIINSRSIIGKCSIVNSGAIIEHECILGDFSHAAPRSVLCGQVKVGNNSHIGASSVIRQGLNIGSDTIIGIGSVVTKDLPDGVVSFGNPCKIQVNRT